MATAHERYEHVDMLDRAEWRAWLEANHATSPGVWLVYWKKAGGPGRLSYAEAVEELFSTRMPVTHAAFVARGRLAP